MPGLSVVILAAGQGKRMRSSLPKVLHRLGHKPMLEFVIDAAGALSPDTVQVVYGHGGDQVRQALGHLPVAWTEQQERLGTGHAVRQAMRGVGAGHVVLVLYGDVPLITPATLRELVACAGDGSIGLLTVTLDDPSGYGRIVRGPAGDVQRIVEEKDADAQTRAVREINTGFMAVPEPLLGPWLQGLGNDNAQREYYLTDIVAMAVADGVRVETVSPAAVEEVMGVNDRAQLAALERYYQMKQVQELMEAGVAVRDPARLDIRGEVETGHDVGIDVNVILEGRVVLGDGVTIGANCILRDAEIGAGTEILPNSLIEETVVGAGCRVGPFARLRPETRLADRVHVGNFVEIKKSDVRAGSKINHLSYIGDTGIGERVNVGAGTITCNYDGAFKHRTVIGDDVFIGSDTQLVAPVEIGAGATIGAGSTITRDAPPGKLTLCRARDQVTIDDWKRPQKDR